MAFPITFAGLASPVPASYLDQNFNYVTLTFMPLAGGTLTGPIVFTSLSGGTDVSTVNLEATGIATLNTVNAGSAVTLSAGFFPTLRVVTAAGAVTVVATDYTVVVNKTVGAATTVNLPATPVAKQFYWIKDGKGDANINNITITPGGGLLIDGAATLVLSTAHASVGIQFDGTQWEILAKM